MTNHIRWRAAALTAIAVLAISCGRQSTAPTPSNPAVTTSTQANCTVAISPASLDIPRDHWTGSIDVITGGDCQWTASTSAPWLRLGSTRGTGSASLAYEADFNPETRELTRTAVIEVAPLVLQAQTVRVSQSPSCHIVAHAAPNGLPTNAAFSADINGGQLTIGAAGGTAHLIAQSEPFRGCAWTIEGGDAWVGNSPPVHAVNGGDIDTLFSVLPNPSSTTRTAVVTMGGWPLSVVQQGR